MPKGEVVIMKIINNTVENPNVPKEGDLFKVIESHGRTFEIRYGFYEECDRLHRFAEPMEIYPDFIKEPQYTDSGIPFVTAIQDPCEYFNGKKDENSTCDECSYYVQCEDLLGICTCPENRIEERNGRGCSKRVTKA